MITLRIIEQVRRIRDRLHAVHGSARGQAAVEYVVVLGTLIAATAILVVFLIAFREFGERTLALAGSEYP